MSGRQAAFPRDARLLRPAAYRAVFAKGGKFVCPGFVVIAAANERDNPRLGLALAKRRIGRAVDRNRVKRVVRESFRHHQATLGAHDLVILARSRTAQFSNADLFAQLTRVWGRIAASPTST